MPLTEHTTQILAKIKAAIDKDSLASSIFSNISLRENTSYAEKNAGSKILSLAGIVHDIAKDKNAVLAQFEADKAKLSTIQNSTAQEETALFLLQKYGSRLLPADSDQADIPLVDDHRVERITHGHKEFTLLKGDFSGIQEFIYGDIKTDQIGDMKRTSKGLRGKSFFVSVLTNLAADCFLQALDLSNDHLLFAGGGHFNLLLPTTDTSKTEKIINSIAAEINESLSGKLHLLTATTNTGTEIIKNASTAFSQINEQRDQAKYQPFIGNLLGQMQPYFITEEEKREELIKYQDIGGVLPKSEYLLQLRLQNAQETFKPSYPFVVLHQSCGNVLLTFEIKDKKSVVETLEKFLTKRKDKIESAKLIRINDTNFLENADLIDAEDLGFPISYGFRFVGKYAPTVGDLKDLADFEEIEKMRPKGSGDSYYKKLAFLRLDIDDLGAVFGFGQEKKSLKHVAVLSRELDLFFAGHFNSLAEEHQCYVVYSGGDDAFIVGSWLNAIRFIRELRKDFKTFTANNSDLNFSAGMFTAGAHYPVAKAAKDAGKTEERAKANFGKNSICLFNHALTFEKFEEMIKLGNLMIKHTADKDGEANRKLSRSLVYKILGMIKHSFEEEVVEGTENGKTTYKKQIKMNAYKLNLNKMRIHNLFARHKFDEKETATATDELTTGVIKVFLQGFVNAAKEGEENKSVGKQKTQILRDYTVALNYVLYNVREQRQHGQKLKTEAL